MIAKKLPIPYPMINMCSNCTSLPFPLSIAGFLIRFIVSPSTIDLRSTYGVLYPLLTSMGLHRAFWTWVVGYGVLAVFGIVLTIKTTNRLGFGSLMLQRHGLSASWYAINLSHRKSHITLSRQVGFDLVDVQIPLKLLHHSIANRIEWRHGNL